MHPGLHKIHVPPKLADLSREEDAPCEIQIYVKTSSKTQNYEKRHIITNTFWITLLESQSWLYFTPGKQEIVINRKNQKKIKL